MALPALDPVIHQPTRLRIMALLFRNRVAAFTWVRDTLGLTDGNLDTHAAKLEEAGYVKRGRTLDIGGFQVRMKITPEGDAAFRAYLEGLRVYLAMEPGSARPSSREDHEGEDDPVDGVRDEGRGHGDRGMGQRPDGDVGQGPVGRDDERPEEEPVRDPEERPQALGRDDEEEEDEEHPPEQAVGEPGREARQDGRFHGTPGNAGHHGLVALPVQDTLEAVPRPHSELDREFRGSP